MKRFKTLKKISSAVALSIMATTIIGCGSSDDDAPANDGKISIDFDTIVGSQGSLVCSENGNAKVYTDLGKDGTNSGTIADFRYFVSDLKVIFEDQSTETLVLDTNSYQYYDETNGSVAILDFEDATGNCVDRGNDVDTNKSVTATLSDENKDKSIINVEFTVGVPQYLNHVQFTDIEALNKTSMAWSWQSGRKFTKFEINPENSEEVSRFNYHLGSTGCVSTEDEHVDGSSQECAQPNRAKMNFDMDPTTQKIVLDYSKLLTNVDITTDLGGAAGCMSGLTDPECSADSGKMLNMIGLDDDNEVGLCIDGDCTSNQQLFSVTDK